MPNFILILVFGAGAEKIPPGRSNNPDKREASRMKLLLLQESGRIIRFWFCNIKVTLKSDRNNLRGRGIHKITVA